MLGVMLDVNEKVRQLDERDREIENKLRERINTKLAGANGDELMTVLQDIKRLEKEKEAFYPSTVEEAILMGNLRWQ